MRIDGDLSLVGLLGFITPLSHTIKIRKIMIHHEVQFAENGKQLCLEIHVT